MPDLPSKFIDLTRDCYPFTMEAFDVSGRVVWECSVDGPGAVYVPPLHKEHGPVGITIRTANGQTHTTPPPVPD